MNNQNGLSPLALALMNSMQSQSAGVPLASLPAAMGFGLGGPAIGADNGMVQRGGMSVHPQPQQAFTPQWFKDMGAPSWVNNTANPPQTFSQPWFQNMGAPSWVNDILSQQAPNDFVRINGMDVHRGNGALPNGSGP